MRLEDWTRPVRMRCWVRGVRCDEHERPEPRGVADLDVVIGVSA